MAVTANPITSLITQLTAILANAAPKDLTTFFAELVILEKAEVCLPVSTRYCSYCFVISPEASTCLKNLFNSSVATPQSSDQLIISSVDQISPSFIDSSKSDRHELKSSLIS
jgi:hypothetical protein